MGAYGSPELYPQEPKNNYSQYSYKPKAHRVAFFIGGFFSGVVIVNLFVWSNKPYTGKTIQARGVTPEVYSTAPSFVSSAAPETIDSQEYLKNWSESSVAKCLLYPDSALFSKNDSDWIISQQGEVCTISSFVSAKCKDNTMGKSTFTVQIKYDNMYAQITSVQIGDKVVYDINKTK